MKRLIFSLLISFSLVNCAHFEDDDYELINKFVSKKLHDFDKEEKKELRRKRINLIYKIHNIGLHFKEKGKLTKEEKERLLRLLEEASKEVRDKRK